MELSICLITRTLSLYEVRSSELKVSSYCLGNYIALTSAMLWEGDTWPLRDQRAEEDDLEIITITTTNTPDSQLTKS